MSKQDKEEKFDEEMFLLFAYQSEKSTFVFYELESRDLNDGQSIEGWEKNGKATRKAFGSKLGNGIGPGIIVKVKTNKGRERITYSKLGPDIVGVWKNNDDRMMWMTKNKTFQLRKRTLDRSRENLIWEQLAPLREAYKDLRYDERSLFLAEIINIITK